MFKGLFTVKKKSKPVRRPSTPQPVQRSYVVEPDPFRYVAPPKKSKRDKRGYERFDYYGVSGSEFMTAMRTGRYQGEKISRKGSSIGEFVYSDTRRRTDYTLAIKIPKKDRYVR